MVKEKEKKDSYEAKFSHVVPITVPHLPLFYLLQVQRGKRETVAGLNWSTVVVREDITAIAGVCVCVCVFPNLSVC